MEEVPECPQSEGQQRRPTEGTDIPSENQRNEQKPPKWPIVRENRYIKAQSYETAAVLA